MKQGLLIILSGPSGVGKGVLRKKLLKDKDLNLAYSVSMTSRQKRAKEINGRDYVFVSKEKFEEMIKNDEFIEYVQYLDNYYGTPKRFVEDNLKAGKNVLLEIEVEGAARVMAKYKGMYTLAIFLAPPNIKELERRIRLRDTEDDEEIKKRIAKAQNEILEKDKYDVVLTNYTVKKTVLRFTQAVENRIANIERLEKGLPLEPGYKIKRP